MMARPRPGHSVTPKAGREIFLGCPVQYAMMMLVARRALPRTACLRSGVRHDLRRAYRCHNRIDDVLSASEAWHALAPYQSPHDTAALRETFKRLNLDGSGKIHAYELRMALLEVRQ